MMNINAGQIEKMLTVCVLGASIWYGVESLSLCKMPLLVTGGAFLLFGTISGTKAPKKMSKDLNKEKPFKRAVLWDRNGDLTKEWYVEYYACEDLKNDLVRKRIKIAFPFFQLFHALTGLLLLLFSLKSL